jgi:HK97 family phage prohead protease
MSALAETLVDAGYDAAEILGRQYAAITGMVVPWDTPTIVGPFVEEWKRGAFTRSLTKQPKLPLLPFHDARAVPLGQSVGWQDEPEGLYGIFRVLMTSAAQVAADYASQGIMSGLSIGFVGEAAEWRYASTYAPEQGAGYMDHVTRTQARLVEVSLVNTPAFVDAQVTRVDAVPAGTGRT